MNTQTYYIGGALLYAVIEWWLPRTSAVKARSVLEAIANALSLIPGVARIVSPLASPEIQARQLPPDPPSVGPGPSSLVVFLASCLALSSCAETKQVAIDTGTCTLSALPSAVTSILGAVEDLLISNQTDAQVESNLEALGTQYGAAILSCALQASVRDLFGQLKKAQATDPRVMHAIQRAYAYKSK